MLGAEAEERAAQHLRSLGREILARNYRIRGGEVDLVSREVGSREVSDAAGNAPDVLVFSEVRQRKNAQYGSALESITPRKLALMRRATTAYLLREIGHEDVRCRLEVISIEGEALTGELSILPVD